MNQNYTHLVWSDWQNIYFLVCCRILGIHLCAPWEEKDENRLVPCAQSPKGQIPCNSRSPGANGPASVGPGQSCHLASGTKSGGMSVLCADSGPVCVLPSLQEECDAYSSRMFVAFSTPNLLKLWAPDQKPPSTSPGSLLERQHFSPHPDLLSQNQPSPRIARGFLYRTKCACLCLTSPWAGG